MEQMKPRSPEELAEGLKQAAASGKRIRLEGNQSKARIGGPVSEADVLCATTGLDQLISFEPKDLTISVGAGMPYSRFTQLLDEHGMMVPIDPPFASSATVGGVVAANSSGPRRRWFGTPRDLVIGMKFATLDGKVVQSGGMVVKNVAGLDMGKLLIGSLGTLAAIAVVNFKLIPKPPASRTFVREFPGAKEALELRDRVLQGVLQPQAVDLLNPAAASALGRKGWVLAIGVAGNPSVLDRYRRELDGDSLEGEAETRFWEGIQEFTPRFLERSPEGCVVRCSVVLSGMEECVTKLPGAIVARAANGVCYAHLDSPSQAAGAMKLGKSIMEYGPIARTAALGMWPQKDSGFSVMQKIKQMFDPNHLLNRGRFYGDI